MPFKNKAVVLIILSSVFFLFAIGGRDITTFAPTIGFIGGFVVLLFASVLVAKERLKDKS